ncbi:Uncharacterised protein [uncultured archaeon]|nr:Uncharacterised protein [uncultured archaeon]
MEKKKINKIISMYTKPVLGTFPSEKRVMALSIDKNSNNPIQGLAREITKSQGSVDVPGFIDKSKLIIVESKDGLSWKKTKDLEIKGIKEIIKKLSGKDRDFIGLEDPDIWTDEKGVKHIYFTIAFKLKNKIGYKIYLGHAQGNSLQNINATKPVLGPIGDNIVGFKEVCISPLKSKAGRFTLTESGVISENKDRSAVALSIAKDMSKPWEFLGIVLDPKKMKYNWCLGHLSPCTFFPEEKINIKGYLVGIINGRETSRKINGKKIYGKFCPGIMLFNPKTGEIPWISKKPLFEDPDARTITFASDFISRKNKDILYCHINDSFVRAYEINFKELKKYIEENTLDSI